jgi:TolB protein
VSDQTGYDQIFAIGSDGQGLTDLSNDPSAMYFSPAWSPDGAKLAFVVSRDGNNDIYVMNADGTGRVRLAPGWSPAWSPEGSEIAFASDRSGTDEICVMSRDGTHRRVVTTSISGNQTPDWQPLPG